MKRRTFFKATAAGAGAGALGAAVGVLGAATGVLRANSSAYAQTPAHPVVISSKNGLKATEKAMELLEGGADTLDAVVAGVNIVEADPSDSSVGLGGLPNEAGVVQLDASVMHGPTRGAGAVACIENILHPSTVAKLVMERTDHVLLVGRGAYEFARAMGMPHVELLTEESRESWLRWKQNLSGEDDWIDPRDRLPANSPLRRSAVSRYDFTYGTINCSAIDAKGDISVVTTTSGLSYKIPGRVGDSPIIGAGLYVDNGVGACGSTGRGEANLKTCASFLGVEFMRNGDSPEEAGLKVLQRISENTTEPYLLNDEGRPNFQVLFYLLNKRGEHAGVAMYSGGQYAVHDGTENKLRDCGYLYKA